MIARVIVRSGALLVALLASVALAAEPAPRDDASPLLKVEGMTFVSSRGGDAEVVLHAKRAFYHTGEERADLREVDARVNTRDADFAFSVRCDSGELDLASNDFVARGNVDGETDSGQHFSADWVRYDHAEGVLFTDAPVLITEDSGTYRGGGFRYVIKDRSFKLLGGASLVQEPS